MAALGEGPLLTRLACHGGTSAAVLAAELITHDGPAQAAAALGELLEPRRQWWRPYAWGLLRLGRVAEAEAVVVRLVLGAVRRGSLFGRARAGQRSRWAAVAAAGRINASTC